MPGHDTPLHPRPLSSPDPHPLHCRLSRSLVILAGLCGEREAPQGMRKGRELREGLPMPTWSGLVPMCSRGKVSNCWVPSCGLCVRLGPLSFRQSSLPSGFPPTRGTGSTSVFVDVKNFPLIENPNRKSRRAMCLNGCSRLFRMKKTHGLSSHLMLTEHQKVKLLGAAVCFQAPSVVERALLSRRDPSLSLQGPRIIGPSLCLQPSGPGPVWP